MNYANPSGLPAAVDVHSHIMPLSYLQLVERDPERYRVKVERRTEGYVLKPDFWTLGKYIEYGPFHDIHFDWDARLRHMDATGVRTQVLSATQSLSYYWAPPDVALDVCRLSNDAMAEATRHHPGRFQGLASLPMQDTAAAIEELERAIGDLHLCGVQLLTNIDGKNIFDRSYLPILQRIHDLDVPIFIHPYGCLNNDRMAEGFLANVVGFPTELAVAGAGLILSGLLDELPRLRVLLGHGGGALLYLLGRITRGYQVIDDLQEQLKREPRAYLDHFYIDSLLHDDRALTYALQTIGPDRMLFGTDWPFWMKDPDMSKRLTQIGLTDADHQRIRAGNAIDLFALPAAEEGSG